LASLVDKSLLVRSVDGRYSFHFLISQLLTQKLSVYPHERDLTEEEHVRYFLTFLDEFDSPQKQADLMNIIEIEIANFRQAWLWSLNNLEVIALRTLLHLMTFFERRARFQEGLLFFSSPKNWEVFEHTSELQDVLGSILLNRAWLHYRLGQLSEVQKLVEKGMDMLFPNNYLGMINGLNLRGLVNHSFGNYDDARRYFSETIQIARAYSVEKAIPSGLNNLAQVETTLGNFASAKTYYLEALSLYEKSRNKFGIVATLKNLGELNLKIKQYQEAKHNLIRGLKIAKEVKHEIYMPEILNCLALVSFELNKYEEALHLTEEALKYAKISGDPHLEARVSISFGRISLKLNDAFQAARYFRHAIEISWLHKNIPLALQGLIDLAELLISLDKIDQAKNILRITLNHSSIDFDSRSKANNLLVQIDSTMSTNQFSLGTTASFSFEQEVEQLLQEPFV
jgi:tetratricopeptide (TPR) repeat protein